jgi:hypothetical protein
MPTLSLKIIPAQNSSQRDIKHPLERMSAKIALQRGNRRKKEREKEKREGDRERASEREGEEGRDDAYVNLLNE